MLSHSNSETVPRALIQSKRVFLIYIFTFLKLFATCISPASWHQWGLGHSYLPHTAVLARTAVRSVQRFISAGVLSPANGQKGMPGERVQEPVSSRVPYSQWISFPLSWSISHPFVDALSSRVLQNPNIHKLLLQCDATLPLPRVLLHGSGTLALQSTSDWLHISKWNLLVVFTRGYFGKIFLSRSQNG